MRGQLIDGRIRDDDGHLWPITGQWCETCHMPLIPTHEATTHPNCEEQP